MSDNVKVKEMLLSQTMTTQTIDKKLKITVRIQHFKILLANSYMRVEKKIRAMGNLSEGLNIIGSEPNKNLFGVTTARL